MLKSEEVRNEFLDIFYFSLGWEGFFSCDFVVFGNFWVVFFVVVFLFVGK